MTSKRGKPPASFVRERSPAYAADDASGAAARSVFPIVIGARGRVVLPAEVRERLGIREGDRLALIVDADGSLKLQTRTVVIRNLRGAFKHLEVRGGGSIVDGLIAERRREAATEERESRAFASARRRRKAPA